jgi:tetratricopeptide (TPR) repeat protein
VARGGSYHLLGQHDKGIEDRTRAIGLSPSAPLGWTARGYAYFLLERWDEALSDLDQATKLDPKNAEVKRLREEAQAHVDERIKQAHAKELAPETGNVTLPVSVDAPATPATVKAQAPVPAPTPAAAATEVAKVPEPIKPAAAPLPAPPPVKHATTAAEYQQQGRKLIQEEHFAQAIEPLTQAVKLDPFLATNFNARGFAYYRLKKLKEAIADFDQAIKLNPTYANAYTNRGVARRAAGDTAGADADQAKARKFLKAAAK